MKTTSSHDNKVAPPLATRTDLSDEQVSAVAAAVNPIVADAFALYVKTKNFHWHVSGPRFRDLHLLIDKQAKTIYEGIDPLAERVRKLGATTIRSIGGISKLTQVRDDDDLYVPAQEMIRRLLEDNLAIAKSQRKAIEICEKNNDSPTSNLLQEILDETERRIWFLYETLQDGDPQSVNR